MQPRSDAPDAAEQFAPALTLVPAPAPAIARTIGKHALRYGTTGIALAAASIAASSTSAAADDSYKVQYGDTVSQIAQTWGVSAQSIRATNNLDAQFRIRAGQTLAIPAKSTAAATPKSTQAAAPMAPQASTTHRVVAGDTVSALARTFGTTSSAIIKTNSLGADALIRIGQLLTIPSAGVTSTTASPVSPQTPNLVGDTFAGRTYSRDVVSAANQNKAALLASTVPSKAEMQQLIRDTANAYGVDPALALAVAKQESGFDQRAVSPANAIGTMQVIPSSGDWASTMVGRELNLLDPKDNVTAGVVILSRLVSTSSSLDNAIAGYYQGQTSVRKYGMFDDTRRYVANVQTLTTQFR